MFSNVFGQYLGALKEIPKNEAPSLHHFLEESCQKLGISRPVKLISSDSPIPNLMALQTGKKVKGHGPSYDGIIITDGARKLLNEQEMKAVIGHELSHLKDGKFLTHQARTLPIYALPMLFGAAYYILDKAYREQQKNEHTKISLPDAIQHVISEDIKAAQHFIVDEQCGFKPDKNSTATRNLVEEKAALYESVLRIGGTIAAATAGFAVGIGNARHLSLRSEFRADRMGAMLTGNPQAVASGFTKMIAYMEEMASKQKFSQSLITSSHNIDTALSHFFKRIKGYFKQEMMLADIEYTHAHPTIAQRVRALQKIPASSFQDIVTDSRSAVGAQLSV